MIRDLDLFREWEDEFIVGEPADFLRNLRLYEAMYEHACALDVFPSEDPLQGIEFKIRLVEKLNVRIPARDAGAGV